MRDDASDDAPDDSLDVGDAFDDSCERGMYRFVSVDGGGHRRWALATGVGLRSQGRDEQHDNNSEGVLVRHAILLTVLLLTSACARQQVSAPSSGGSRTSSGGSAVGAPSSRAAVEGFLAAVKDADLQRMSTLWGNDRGPARDRIARDEFEKRLVIMQCSLQHDRSAFNQDGPQLRAQGRQAWDLTLTRKRVSKRATMVTVQGPAGRWFVEDVPNIGDLRELCS